MLLSLTTGPFYTTSWQQSKRREEETSCRGNWVSSPFPILPHRVRGSAVTVQRNAAGSPRVSLDFKTGLKTDSFSQGSSVVKSFQRH